MKVNHLVLAAMRGVSPQKADEQAPTTDEVTMAMLLQKIWFAALVDWPARLHGQAQVVQQVRRAAELLMAGISALPSKGWAKR